MSFGPCFLPVSLSAIPFVAVAVARSDPSDDRYYHAAIAYRTSSGVSALEFDLDGTIGNVEPDWMKQCIWAIPKMPRGVAIQIASYCQTIEKSNAKFAYDFEFRAKTQLVDQKTHFAIDGGTVGFTCATFVLAVFQTKQFPLVKVDDWKLTAEDRNWQQSMVSYLRRHGPRRGVTQQQVDYLEQKMLAGCLRYTPMDAIGSCRVGTYPAECSPTKDAGTECTRWLSDCHGIPGAI